LLRGIGERSFSDREKYGDPFLGAHLTSRQRIRLIGFLEAFENANGLLHIYILPPPVDSMIYFSGTGAFTEFPGFDGRYGAEPIEASSIASMTCLIIFGCSVPL
jgi:hypothetical protein